MCSNVTRKNFLHRLFHLSKWELDCNRSKRILFFPAATPVTFFRLCPVTAPHETPGKELPPSGKEKTQICTKGLDSAPTFLPCAALLTCLSSNADCSLPGFRPYHFLPDLLFVFFSQGNAAGKGWFDSRWAGAGGTGGGNGEEGEGGCGEVGPGGVRKGIFGRHQASFCHKNFLKGTLASHGCPFLFFCASLEKKMKC